MGMGAGQASGRVAWWRDNRLVPNGPLQGLMIGVTAERRAAEQANLLHKRGAEVLLGPALRVFSSEDDEVLKASHGRRGGPSSGFPARLDRASACAPGWPQPSRGASARRW